MRLNRIFNLQNIKLTAMACLCLFIAATGYAENGPTPKTFVGSGEITDNSITNSKMADDSVGADELIDGSVGTAAIAAGYNLITDAEKANLTATKFITYTKLHEPLLASSVSQFTELGPVEAGSHAGYLAVQNSSNGDTSIIALVNGATVFIQGDSQIGVTKDEETNINVYVESGYVQIQNTYVGAANVRVVYWGAKY